MYIFINEGLGMSPGKIAAQASHAAVEAYKLSSDYMIDGWERTGTTKLVMSGRDAEHLRTIHDYLTRQNFLCHLVIDEGRTEIPSHSITALGVEIVEREDEKVKFAFSDFQTMKAPAAPDKFEPIQIGGAATPCNSHVWEMLRAGEIRKSDVEH